jgi:type IX secretion system PorP/SprF family membrane protein
MIKRSAFILVLSLLVAKSFLGYSQDVHFSQYFSAPMILNPALAGQFDGKFRYTNIYKTQWNSISQNAYRTYATSIDGVLYKSNVFGGISFFRDRAGDSKMGTTDLNATIASRIRLNSTNSLTAGLQIGLLQNSIDLTDLTWNNQIDGKIFNPDIDAKEYNSSDKKFNLNIAAGMYWKSVINDYVKCNLGFSAYHLNTIALSYYNTDNVLNRRFCLHGGLELTERNTNVTYMPSFMILKQGSADEYNLGLIVKYQLGMTSKYTGARVSSDIFFGAFTRFNDAFILYTRFLYKNSISFGLSYDVNFSTLKSVSHTRGGTEMSLIYVFNMKKISVKLVDPSH